MHGRCSEYRQQSNGRWANFASAAARRLDRAYTSLAEAFLVIEVADTTFLRDKRVKALEYAKVGLPELWIVHVEAQETLQLRAPGPQGYGETTAVPFAAPLSPLCAPQVRLRLAELAG